MSQIEISLKINEIVSNNQKLAKGETLKPDLDIEQSLQEIIKTNDITQARSLANDILNKLKKDKGEGQPDVLKPEGIKEFIDKKYGKGADEKI